MVRLRASAGAARGACYTCLQRLDEADAAAAADAGVVTQPEHLQAAVGLLGLGLGLGLG